jgi:CheY-like chemotaxis protein
VQRLGGRIEVKSAPGAGTTFTIHLPTLPETTEMPLDLSAPVGRGVILVVEDDPFVRESVGFYLRRLGYTPLVAADGRQAIELARNPSVQMDVLLTDVMMPHQLGRDLANEVRALRPDIDVLYMSAHPKEDLAERGRVEADAAVIQKPFDEQRLGMMLHKLMQE